jgi:hypothetical protein
MTESRGCQPVFLHSIGHLRALIASRVSDERMHIHLKEDFTNLQAVSMSTRHRLSIQSVIPLENGIQLTDGIDPVFTGVTIRGKDGM